MRIRYPLFLLFYLVFSSVFAKQTMDISFHHDSKFLFIGDERGNDAGTLDFILRADFRLKKFARSYLTVGPSYEYADLVGGTFTRYSLGIGYVREKVFLKNLSFGVYPNYGLISRQHSKTGSFGINIDIFYKISKRFSLSYVHQTLERTDFIALYDSQAHIHASSFVGFKIHL